MIYPQQVQRALDFNLMALVEANQNLTFWHPEKHPKKWRYWSVRQAALQRKRALLKRMEERGQGLAYEREELELP